MQNSGVKGAGTRSLDVFSLGQSFASQPKPMEKLHHPFIHQPSRSESCAGRHPLQQSDMIVFIGPAADCSHYSS